MASGKNGPPTTTNSGNMYSISLFMIAVCGLADGVDVHLALPGDRAAAGQVGGDAGQDGQRDAPRDDRRADAVHERPADPAGMVMKPTSGAPPGSLASPIDTTSAWPKK